LLEKFLVEVLGMDWSEVHEEAEQLEHAVSDRVLERMDEMLGHPQTDPHGDPIPTAQGEVEEPALPSLLTCSVGVALRVARVCDQSPEFLQQAERKGLKIGNRLTVRQRSTTTDTVELEVDDGRELSLGFRAGEKILVEEPAS
jgi:DtxR family Mn-dependent transcriptional regulator